MDLHPHLHMTAVRLVEEITYKLFEIFLRVTNNSLMIRETMATSLLLVVISTLIIYLQNANKSELANLLQTLAFFVEKYKSELRNRIII